MNNDAFEKLQVFSKKVNSPVLVSANAGAISGVKAFDVQNDWQNWSKQAWYNWTGWANGWNNTWANGCYITSACVEHKGMADDCDVLKLLRVFRDETAAKDETFRNEVLDYYTNAPKIVEKINASDDKDQVLDDLYENMIMPCVSMIKEGKDEECKELYSSYYRKLVEKYL